jgi:hypothetical protein
MRLTRMVQVNAQKTAAKRQTTELDMPASRDMNSADSMRVPPRKEQCAQCKLEQSEETQHD